MLSRFAAESQGNSLVAVGVSLGGNALLKWLGEEGVHALGKIRCAVSISAPLDLTVAGPALGRGFNRAYARMFLSSLKRKVRDKADRFPGLIDEARVRSARTLREFDDALTAPLHGFRDAEDYWQRASSRPWLPYIRVPSLIVNARNDPFLPLPGLPLPGEVSQCVELEFPEQGGHVGFPSPPFPGNFSWFGERIMRFIRQHLA